MSSFPCAVIEQSKFKLRGSAAEIAQAKEHLARRFFPRLSKETVSVFNNVNFARFKFMKAGTETTLLDILRTENPRAVIRENCQGPEFGQQI